MLREIASSSQLLGKSYVHGRMSVVQLMIADLQEKKFTTLP